MQRKAALDLGAGQGELVEAMLRLSFAQATGVDFSPSQVQLAQGHGCHAVRQGEGGQALAELQDASLDLVVCFDVFEHLSHDTCGQWFAQIRRVLKPGGRLIGLVPNGLSPFAGAVYWVDLTHLWCPVPESIQVFCRSSGLRWLGAYENIGGLTWAQGPAKGAVMPRCEGRAGSCLHGENRPQWIWLALEPSFFFWWRNPIMDDLKVLQPLSRWLGRQRWIRFDIPVRFARFVENPDRTRGHAFSQPFFWWRVCGQHRQFD